MFRSGFAIGALSLLTACGNGASGEYSTAPSVPAAPAALVIAPILSNSMFCDEALGRPGVQTEDQAAVYCASLGKTAAKRIESSLAQVGPKESPSGRFQLGFTLQLPMFRYFKRGPSGWEIDETTLRGNLQTIVDSSRPVVVHLSGTHFNFAGLELSAELAGDPRNVMWTRDGPSQSEDYFGVNVTGWSLVDLEAPVNRMRGQAFRAAIDALCALPSQARGRIFGVSILGETHYVFPDLRAGPGDDVAASKLTDYSPAMVAGFQAWLGARYTSIAALNTAIGGNAGAFTEVRPPAAQFGVDAITDRLHHIDRYASGTLTVSGWLHDRAGRDFTVSVLIDGSRVGDVILGLSRTDVTEAIPSIENPNVGFRLDIDHRGLPPGTHTVDVEVTPSGAAPLLLGSRQILVVDSDLSESPRTYGYPNERPSIATDLQLAGSLDAPGSGITRVLYNPLARLWMAYREEVVRRYYEHFAQIAASGCFARDQIFSHQIAPSLYGGWNDEVLGVAGTQRPNAYFTQGATLYGGTAFGKAFFDLKTTFGWTRYGVNELHPLVPLTEDQYLAMMFAHRDAGAVFLAPYYMETLPVTGAGGDTLERFLITPGNTRLASDLFYAALRALMTR